MTQEHKDVQAAINQYLGTGQPGPLLTWKKVERICEQCHQPFLAHVATNKDGTELPSMVICYECDQFHRNEEDMKQFTQEVIEQNKKVRATWIEILPITFRDKTFANFDAALQPKAFDKLSNYDWKTGKSLVLLSPDLYGIGKTHLVCALSHKLFDILDPVVPGKDMLFRYRPCPVTFVAENVILARIRQTYNRSNAHNDDEFYEETEEDVYGKILESQVLIIDDVGKVRPRDLNFLQSFYFRVIDNRYNSGKPVVITTNLSFTELESHIGGASADRLREMCGKDGFIKMSGKSYRK